MNRRIGPALKQRFTCPGLLALTLILPAAPARAETATRARFLMGTVCEITAHGPAAGKAIDAAFAEISRLDRALSLFREDSELSRLNRRAVFEPVPCSNELFEAMHAANEAYQFSGGAFDPTFVPGWPAPGFNLVVLHPNNRTVEFKDPTIRVSLDGVGKGYALDAAALALRSHGASSALMNFGGQVLAVGAPPGQDAWGVEVAGAWVTVRLRDQSIATSSQQEQPGHIRDPRTGDAVDRKSAVAVIAGDGAHADAWSTALFVLGVAKAPKGFAGCAFETLGGKIIARTRACDAFLGGGPAPADTTWTTNKERQQWTTASLE